MKRIILTIVVVIVSTALVYSQGEVCAVVVYTKGSVEVLRSGEKEYKKIKVNETLFPGDKIKTGKGGRASVVIKSGAEIRINSDSEFEVSPEGNLKEVVKLNFGQIWTKMLHKMGTVNVKTLAAVCAIRGTEADIEQRNLLTVKVYEGQVDVENALGKQSLFAGQMTTVSGPNAAPQSPRQMDKKDIGTWQEKINVKDIEKIFENLKNAKDEKVLKIKINKGGKEKEVEVKMKKKN
jgi:hypothetical protein